MYFTGSHPKLSRFSQMKIMQFRIPGNILACVRKCTAIYRPVNKFQIFIIADEKSI